MSRHFCNIGLFFSLVVQVTWHTQEHLIDAEERELILALHFYLSGDGYYVAYKPITLLSILFMYIEMKFIHCHSCVMFVMKSMSRCND